MFDQVYILEW